MLLTLTESKGQAHLYMLTFYFNYLFGNITKNELKEHFAYHDLNIEKLNLVNHGYLCRNCKLYIYALKSKKVQKPSAYGIENEDVKILKFVAEHLEIKETSWSPWNLNQLKDCENSLIQNLKTYVGKFISKKLIFLIKSYGLERHDLESELYCAGLWALHKKYPYFVSVLHLTNIFKNAVHNKGMDIINKHTRGKNQRLIRNDDGSFEAVHVDVSNLRSLEAPEPFHMRYRDEREGLKSLQAKMNDRGALYISLARGDYNADFSDYLGLDNRLAAEQNYDGYLKKIDGFLGVSLKERDKFFKKLRRVL